MNAIKADTPEEAAQGLIRTYGLPYDADKFRMLLELAFQMGVMKGVEQCKQEIVSTFSRPPAESETLIG